MSIWSPPILTPPVAMAVYAANGISQAGLWDTGLAAVKMGATGYIVPFMFVFGPSILMIGEWQTIGLTAGTAILGVICLSSGLFGYLQATGVVAANPVPRGLPSRRERGRPSTMPHWPCPRSWRIWASPWMAGRIPFPWRPWPSGPQLRP